MNIERGTSVRILANLVRTFFHSEFGREPYILDPELRIGPFPTTEKFVDVVVFGDFARQLAARIFWSSENKYRIWTLSEASAKVAREMLLIKDVGVLPRYKLFPIKAQLRGLPTRKESFHLVYSGRLNETKNVLNLVRTVSILQTEHRLPVELSLIGNFDSFAREEKGRRINRNFSKALSRELKALSWINPPSLIKPVESHEWTQRFRKRNPVFISFSTFFKDDFGVSAAQAQSEGWPLIVSAWGGYRDIRGPNVLHVPALICEGNPKKCANLIALGLKRTTLYGEKVIHQIPKQVTYNELANSWLILAQKYPNILEVGEGFLKFHSTKSGRDFISHYRNTFSGF